MQNSIILFIKVRTKFLKALAPFSYGFGSNLGPEISSGLLEKVHSNFTSFQEPRSKALDATRGTVRAPVQVPVYIMSGHLGQDLGIWDRISAHRPGSRHLGQDLGI